MDALLFVGGMVAMLVTLKIADMILNRMERDFAAWEKANPVPGEDMFYCLSCGAVIQTDAGEICPACGERTFL